MGAQITPKYVDATAGLVPPYDEGALRIETDVDDGEATVRLFGDLDLATAPILQEAIARVQAGAPLTVVLDLSGLEFIDSSGLHQFVVALKRQREDGGEVVLRSARPRTLRVLEMVGLTRVFTIE